MGLNLLIFGLTMTLVVLSGFGRSRIRRNCGYTLLATVLSFLNNNEIQYIDIIKIDPIPIP